MNIDFLLKIFRENGKKDAIAWRGKCFKYLWLYKRIGYWIKQLEDNGVEEGEIIVLEADFSPNSIALFLALIEKNCILCPLTPSARSKKDEYIKIAQAERIISIDENESVNLGKLINFGDHEIYNLLRKKNYPGLVLFSSGTTGKSKAAVHNFRNLLEKYKLRRQDLRTLTFLMFDHIGGIDTMLYSLSNGSCLITIQEKSPDCICKAIEDNKVEVLPVTPTFLNLLILSESYKRYDLSSLKYITYGTEVMLEITLKRISDIFPNVKMLQKFGTTETGTLRSKSKSSNSLWVKIGGDGFKTRVVNGLLEIKAESAMLGYLNQESPFTEDGWFKTGDQVEVDGEYLKILGRNSEIINVGGEKVYPTEIEEVILELNNVADVTIYAERNPIIGNIVCARVNLLKEEDKKLFISRLKKHCSSRLQSYKIPIKVVIDNKQLFTERYKKSRK